jgi:hypothetical protein
MGQRATLSVGNKCGQEQGQTGCAASHGISVCGARFERLLGEAASNHFDILCEGAATSRCRLRLVYKLHHLSANNRKHFTRVLRETDRAVNPVLNQPLSTLITFCTQRGKSSRSS